MAEHLGVEVDVLRRTITARDGSLVGAVDSLRRDKGRSLRPFIPPHLSETERLIAETEFLDADRPESMSETFMRAMKALPTPGWRTWSAAAAVLGLSASMLLWNRQRRR